MTNHSHHKIKWCLDMRRSTKVLENGTIRFCNGFMSPFVSNDKNSVGPEGELQPNEPFQLVIMFTPGTWTFKGNRFVAYYILKSLFF
jgi:hypothetical protein